jgi:hypothetical protein
MALLILFDILDGEEKHMGCVETTEDKCGFTEQGHIM